MDHATAILELREHIIREDNPSVGLIPVDESVFVINCMVDTTKLYPVLNDVQKAWQRRIDEETKREEKDDWRSILGS